MMRSRLTGKQVKITNPQHPKYGCVGRVVNSNHMGMNVCVLFLTKNQQSRYWLLASQVEEFIPNTLNMKG